MAAMGSHRGVRQLARRADRAIAVASGILVDFIWKYAASSRFVWNVPAEAARG